MVTEILPSESLDEDPEFLEYIAEEGLAGPPSPFLANSNVQYAWDATCLELFKRCPRLYQYSMIENWTTKEDNVHLRFGIEYHKALEDYDRYRVLNVAHAEAMHCVIKELLIRMGDWKSDHKYKNRHNLVRTVIGYLDKYFDDPAKTYIMENGEPAVEVNFKFPLDWGPETLDSTGIKSFLGSGDENSGEIGMKRPYILCGYLDRVVEYSGSIFVMDRKTTKTTPSEWYFDTYHPGNQMSLYTLAGQMIFESPIKGVIIDVAQVAIDFSRPGVRGFTYRTNEEIQEWTEDLRFWLDQAEACAINAYWPMNDTSCDKYGGCKFRSVCSSSPQIRDKILESHFVRREPWNPLKPR